MEEPPGYWSWKVMLKKGNNDFISKVPAPRHNIGHPVNLGGGEEMGDINVEATKEGKENP